jgi:hypothetical protein
MMTLPGANGGSHSYSPVIAAHALILTHHRLPVAVDPRVDPDSAT